MVKDAGIRVIIAESVAKIYYRNAINNGLPIIICKDITKEVSTGDTIEVDILSGEVKNLTRGRSIRSEPIPGELLEIVNEGGIIPYVKKKYGLGREVKTK